MKVKEIIKASGGRLLSGNPGSDIEPASISTDSRTIRKGDFFIALKGPNYDANVFVNDALAKGAAGALVSRKIPLDNGPGKIIIVAKDTTRALQDIAHYHRMKFNIPVVAVTGSNGKTTTKEMIWHVLSPCFNVLKNEGTKNNNIGVSQTLLKLNGKHKICVLELGTNHKGEIKLLSKISMPSVAVITNIGPSHLEFFDTLDGVFEAKKEILQYLNKAGMAIVNGDDLFLSRINPRRHGILRFGFDKRNDFRASAVKMVKGRLKFKFNAKTDFELRILGLHNVYNALAAIAVGLYFGVDYGKMQDALFNYTPGYMRLNVKRLNGIDVIDDTYNSNPLSMRAAIDALKLYPANAHFIVSADMLELGRHGKTFHGLIGHEIAKAGVDGLVTYGSLSREMLAAAKDAGMKEDRLFHCQSHDEIARILKRIAKKGDAVLIKGSRGMRMEEVIDKLKD